MEREPKKYYVMEELVPLGISSDQDTVFINVRILVGKFYSRRASELERAAALRRFSNGTEVEVVEVCEGDRRVFLEPRTQSLRFDSVKKESFDKSNNL